MINILLSWAFAIIVLAVLWLIFIQAVEWVKKNKISGIILFIFIWIALYLLGTFIKHIV
jgi:hypothetical protein